MIDCQQQLGLEESTSKDSLVCKDCQLKAYGAGTSHCETHGKAQIDWKCNFCCSVALFHCFGTTYFCKRCHDERWDTKKKTEDCGGVNCPLGMPHPPASCNVKESTFPLGCGLCRSDRLAKMRNNKNVIQEVALHPMEFEWQKMREAEEKRKAVEEAERQRVEAERRRVEAERRRVEEERLAEERRQAEARRQEEEARRRAEEEKQLQDAIAASEREFEERRAAEEAEDAELQEILRISMLEEEERLAKQKRDEARMKRKLDEAELVLGLYQEANKTSIAEGQTRAAEL